MAAPAKPHFGAERLVPALAQRIARSFASPARAEPALVIGVFGEWGSGKSTLLESVHDSLAATLATAQQDELPASWTVPIWFNAWRYEREEHLIVPLLKTARLAIAQAFGRGATRDEAFRAAFAAKLELLTDLTVALAQSLDVKIELPLVGALRPSAPWELWTKFVTRRKDRSDADRAEIDRLNSLQHEFHQHLRALTGRNGELFKAQIERVRRRADARWAAPADGDEAERWRRASAFHLNLAFFIDDLDRCLPDKAVEMLEAIKLFLEVDGCAFVLAIDDEVVERGIAHRYKDYLFQGGQRGRGPNSAPASVPITGAEYLEKIVQLPLRLTRPDRRQVESFLVETYPDLFVDPAESTSQRGAAGSPRPARQLLDHVLGVVPPVPRKLVRVVELLRTYEGVIQPRLAGEREKLDRALLFTLVALQLFAPELYRFLRRRGARLLLEMAQWAGQGDFNNLDALAERTRKEQLAGAAAAGGHYDRESYARLPALIKRCQDNRAGFDLRDLLRIVPSLGPEPPLQEYFELFSARDGAAAAPPSEMAAPAPAAPAAWIDATQAGQSLQANPFVREPARLENPEACLDGLLSSDPRAWANALAREAPALRGKVLPPELFERLLRTELRVGDSPPDHIAHALRYLDALGPFLDPTQSMQLAQRAWQVFHGSAERLGRLPMAVPGIEALHLAQWLSRQVAPPWSPREPAPLQWGAGTPPTALPNLPLPPYLRGWAFAPAAEPPPDGAQWTGPVQAAQPNCLDPDQYGTLVAGDSTGQVFLLRFERRLDGWRGVMLGRHASAVVAVALRASGRSAVSVSTDGNLRVWNLGGVGEPEAQAFQLGDEIERVALSADGLHAVSATAQGLLRVWDLDGPSGIVSKEPGFEYHGRIAHLALSADGRRVLVADTKTAQVWSRRGGAYALERTFWRSLGESIDDAAISADASRAAVATSDGELRVWKLEPDAADEPPTVWRGPHSAARRVALSADGSFAVSAAPDNALALWSLNAPQDGEPLVVVQGCEGGVRHVALDAAGERVWSASGDGALRLWDLSDRSTGVELAVWRGPADWLRRVAISADARRAVAVSHDGVLRLWRLGAAGASEPMAAWRADERGINFLALSADGRRAVSTSGDGGLRVWSLGDDSRSLDFDDWPGHEGPVDHVAFSADGRRAISASHDSTLRVWDLVDRSRRDALAVWRGHEKGVHLVAIGADGRRAVSASYDNTLRVWDLGDNAGSEALAVWRGHDSQITHLAVSSDGRRAVSASYDATLRLWDLGAPAHAEALAVWRGHTGAVRHVALADERAVSAGDDGTLRVWGLGEGEGNEALAVWRGHEGVVNQVAISTDGRRVISVADDCTLRVWDLADLARPEPLAVWRLLHRASELCWGGGRIVASGVEGWTLFDGADETARPRLWRPISTTLLPMPGTSLCVTEEGIELVHDEVLHNELDDQRRLLPADPGIFGLLSFAAGEDLYDTCQLAGRLEWPDEAQPRRFRVRWGSDAERQRWLPRLAPQAQPGVHDAT